MSTLKADDMRMILSNHDDFANEKKQVEHYVEGRSFLCLLLSKLHHELNLIECGWGQSDTVELTQISLFQSCG